MKSALLPLAKRRSIQRHVRESRVGRIHRTRMETKTLHHPVRGKSRCRDDKSADRPTPLRLRDSQGCPRGRDEIECRIEICNRKIVHRPQRGRRLRPRNKEFPATNSLHNLVVPSISRRKPARPRAPYGENYWE